MPRRKVLGTDLGSSSISATRRARPRGCPAIETLESRTLLSASTTTAVLHHHHHAVASSPAPITAATLQPASTTSTPAYAGDTNLDGSVNIIDLNTLLAHYGQTTGQTWATGDFDGDGAVDANDLNLLLANYGKTGGGTTIPATGGTITAVQASAPSTITWSGPITITKGGTYTGNWQSLSASTPAVSIQTTQPITILNANIQSKSTLIQSFVHGANITVKNTHGWALNPNVYGQSLGRFLNAEYFSNLDVENNTMAGTSGIEMGYWQPSTSLAGGGTVKVLYNNALNIDGRWSDGNGGFLTGADQNDYVQFAQFNDVYSMSGAEIAWNQVVNQPGQSRPEDNISVFQSSGTASSPILIHDNYIQGAYAADPANDSSYTGGGIMLSDGSTGVLATDPGYVSAYNNIIISTSNYGLAISSGHDDTIYNNTIISSGLLPNGQKIAAENVGIYVWNSVSDLLWGNNQEYGNTLGWMGPNGRNDIWTPNASGKTGDTHLPGSTITLAQEQSYYTVWAQKVATSGFTIGAT
jgi:hypothetical protein